MSTPADKRIDHLEMILGRVFDKALPAGSLERQAVQAELDVIANDTWKDPNIAEAARLMRNAIP